MNLLTYIKMKFTQFFIWVKRLWTGDVRPAAVKPQRKKRTTKRKTK